MSRSKTQRIAGEIIMKSVMLSIQRKWVEKIASGEKTVEVRKTAPEFTPFKCYIYQTKSRNNHIWQRYKVDDMRSGKVIGEFVCDWVTKITPHCDIKDCVNQYIHGYPAILGESDCLSFQEMKAYLGNKIGYDWHISNLKIYDKPKDLREFRRVGVCEDFFTNCMCMEHCQYSQIDYDGNFVCVAKPITRPPQSWCYVEELKEKQK